MVRDVSSVRRARAFSLVELMVVIGIIGLMAGMLLPSLSRARRQAQAALCLSNMRQLGVFYYLYANANHDRIPLGTSAIRPDDLDYYHTACNNFVWRNGAPSSAAGPFILGGLIKPGAAKILYCPLEARESFSFEMYESQFDAALRGEDVTIMTSYAVRPTRNVWITDPKSRTVEYPLMNKLVKLKNFALMSEYPQARPFNHGEPGNAYVNVLYADGSVRQVPYSAFAHAHQQYVFRSPFPIPPGFVKPSNEMAFDETNPVADTIWQNIDRY